jgi:ribosome biogenesis GTPase / thiamine phosphate phosphatase
LLLKLTRGISTLIESYGWSPALQTGFDAFAAEGLTPARVIVQERSHYRLVTDIGEVTAQPSGRLHFGTGEEAYPVAGDWVAVSLREQERGATIHHVLPRRTAFLRKAAGRAQVSQVVAANVDIVLIVTSLNEDLNLRRLERTLAIAWESGARPAIILTKADICADVDMQVRRVEGIADGVTVLAVSVVTGQGMAEFRALVQPGMTSVVLGSSGVGKSTLVNALLGEDRMAVKAIRASDGRGQHTTTQRELVLLPQGGCILDTPGMRELGLWEAEEGVSATFADIEALAGECRFRNCTHGTEPGCAIQAALADGTLDPGRWQSFGKLQKESVHRERREVHPATPVLKKVKPKSTSSSRRRNQEQEEE